ncbi:UbiX family flavin prenyltransferase [Archaeoglobus veneficus]|uniref:Flavin prenyltransferase UbiX n=1 Tax=Archaeoglobus veneficus (strain DSM 11195 / SNP6) TaxID=693661 RepID=F2KQI6_ARCVS|nr:UbiX family flavin prenyltransferase [Archaeoglobus veneficus]AEA47719.1 3-octaprenyl-4-hydroxybenzoate carboxy-lyase [Archaeoglobus veneficus SNP6]
MRLVVALTGASGQIYGIRVLEELAKRDVETHVIVSKAARITLEAEGYSISDVEKLSSYFYSDDELAAPISSGSFRHDGMIVAPCSIKTASSIACGIADNLVTRAADVTLKERRKLLLLVRETPLHTGHLRTLLTLSELGAIIMPPVPAFYIKPKSVDEIVTHTVARALSFFDIEVESKRWEGLKV